MAAVNLTDADITTVLTNASQVVGTFYRDVVTRFPTKKPSELGMTDLFTKEIGCHPLHGRAFHVASVDHMLVDPLRGRLKDILCGFRASRALSMTIPT
jgi:hypothetical protein